MINTEIDLVELQVHLEKLKAFNKLNLPDDHKVKLVAEIEFWEVKLNEGKNELHNIKARTN